MGLGEPSFTAFLQEHTRRTAERVRESDWDALVYYALQSTTFTPDAPIEPALDAKAFVDGLEESLRYAFPLRDGFARRPGPRRATTAADGACRGAATAGRPGPPRVLSRRRPQRIQSRRHLDATLRTEYVRAMRFLYEKEFVAPKRADSTAAIAALYRERGLSTDTAVEAGYLVHLGLATVGAADSARRIQRVLVVGPGLDLAPRTGLIEAGEPESYQPYAIADSLVMLGLARTERLVVLGADVNPRVVDRLSGAGKRDVALTLVTGIGDTRLVKLDDGYRSYFTRLGSAIGTALPEPALGPRYAGHLKKALRVSPAASRVITSARLDVVIERLDGDQFDLVVVTNVFPYMSDVELTLALANIAAMLGPGGVLIHNEPRALVGDVTAELGLPLTYSRTAVIATVEGAPAPLYDNVFVHVKTRSADWSAIRGVGGPKPGPPYFHQLNRAVICVSRE